MSTSLDNSKALDSDLKFYYQVYKWLTYRNDSTKPLSDSNDPQFCLRREMSFVYKSKDTSDDSELFLRWIPLGSAENLKKLLYGEEIAPHKFDIGAVYNLSISQVSIINKKFKQQQRELVFDIDLTDYDDIRTCCSDKSICSKCWRFMSIGVKFLYETLTVDFSFRNILFVFSGRRGIHCWVCDSNARSLPPDARAAIIEYLTLITGSEVLKKRVNLYAKDLHPLIARAFHYCYMEFYNILIEQNYFADKHHHSILLEYIPDIQKYSELRHLISHPNMSSIEIFNVMCNNLGIPTPLEYKQNANKSHLKVHSIPGFFKEVVIHYSFVRLDSNVTHGTFAKKSLLYTHWNRQDLFIYSGRVCVPIDILSIDDFDPQIVPTLCKFIFDIAQLRKEYDESNVNINLDGADKKSSLSKYITYFKEIFLGAIHR